MGGIRNSRKILIGKPEEEIPASEFAPSWKYNIEMNFMVTPCINNIQHFVFQLMHATLKNVELLKHFKITKLLQHVSVYKEIIIREPQPVLS